MILSRELGKRIWGGSTNIENGGGGVSSDTIAGLLTGYAKESWVDEHYISIDFFSRLFQAHGTENGSEIDVMPNDMDTTITSVESMFGFWTNLYISALGSNGAAPAGISLGMLTDVVISGTPSAGQVLTFDAVTQKWVNGNATGASSLSTLTDVTLTSVQNGQTLLYDSTTSKWYNSALKTINGQSLLGSGDISVGGGGGGSYVTYYNTSGSFDANNATAIWNEIQNVPSNVPTSNHGVVISNGNIGTPFQLWLPDNRLEIYKRWKSNGSWNSWAKLQGDDPTKLPLAGGTMTGTIYGNTGNGLVVQSNNKSAYGQGIRIIASSGTDNWAVLSLQNSSTQDNLALVFNITSKAKTIDMLENGVGKALSIPYENGRLLHTGDNSFDNTYGGDIFILSTAVSHSVIDYKCNDNIIWSCGSNSSFGFVIWCSFSQSILFNINKNGNTGIGTISPSYKLHVAGTIYATGAITALSDARKKDIMGEAEVSVEQIAHAPAVQFLWKDKERRKDGQQVGTLAQYWQTVLPEVVMNKGGELSMQYGVAALVSAIVTARKVVDHERRITELEKENERLKEEISQLRLN